MTLYKYRGECILLLVTLLWGSTFTIVKLSLTDASPMYFITLRFAAAAAFFIPLLAVGRIRFNRENAVAGSFLGVLLFLGFAFQTTGLNYTQASKSAFLTGSCVVMVPVLQWVIERERPGAGSMAGIVMVSAGILFLSSGGGSPLQFLQRLGSDFNSGDLLTLVCAFFFALYIVYLDLVSRNCEFLPLLFLQIFVTAVLGCIATGLFHATGLEPIRIVFTRPLVLGLIYTSFLTTLLTTALQTKYQRLVTPTRAGIIFSLEPVFAAVTAYLVLGEGLTGSAALGAVLIFTGLIVSEVCDQPRGER